MTYENIRFISELMASPTFKALLEQLVNDQVAVKYDSLHKAARSGETSESARLAGEIDALQSLPLIFTLYAKKYQIAS